MSWRLLATSKARSTEVNSSDNETFQCTIDSQPMGFQQTHSNVNCLLEAIMLPPAGREGEVALRALSQQSAPFHNQECYTWQFEAMLQGVTNTELTPSTGTWLGFK